jgi:hypothetical protein
MPKSANAGPMARRMAVLGSSPSTMKPPVSTLSSVKTCNRVEMLSSVFGGTGANATNGERESTVAQTVRLAKSGAGLSGARMRAEPNEYRSEQLIWIDIHRSEDIFREGELVERLADEATQPHDRCAPNEDVEAVLALQLLERRGRRRSE